jgi:hypothetical protein
LEYSFDQWKKMLQKSEPLSTTDTPDFAANPPIQINTGTAPSTNTAKTASVEADEEPARCNSSRERKPRSTRISVIPSKTRNLSVPTLVIPSGVRATRNLSSTCTFVLLYACTLYAAYGLAGLINRGNKK